jgi:hypothetical protein
VKPGLSVSESHPAFIFKGSVYVVLTCRSSCKDVIGNMASRRYTCVFWPNDSVCLSSSPSYALLTATRMLMIQCAYNHIFWILFVSLSTRVTRITLTMRTTTAAMAMRNMAARKSLPKRRNLSSAPLPRPRISPRVCPHAVCQTHNDDNCSHSSCSPCFFFGFGPFLTTRRNPGLLLTKFASPVGGQRSPTTLTTSRTRKG